MLLVNLGWLAVLVQRRGWAGHSDLAFYFDVDVVQPALIQRLPNHVGFSLLQMQQPTLVRPSHRPQEVIRHIVGVDPLALIVILRLSCSGLWPRLSFVHSFSNGRSGASMMAAPAGMDQSLVLRWRMPFPREKVKDYILIYNNYAKQERCKCKPGTTVFMSTYSVSAS
jgi:hypothetical protein